MKKSSPRIKMKDPMSAVAKINVFFSRKTAMVPKTKTRDP
jgi:hypothetical protein